MLKVWGKWGFAMGWCESGAGAEVFEIARVKARRLQENESRLLPRCALANRNLEISTFF